MCLDDAMRGRMVNYFKIKKKRAEIKWTVIFYRLVDDTLLRSRSELPSVSSACGCGSEKNHAINFKSNNM